MPTCAWTPHSPDSTTDSTCGASSEDEGWSPPDPIAGTTHRGPVRYRPGFALHTSCGLPRSGSTMIAVLDAYPFP